MIRSRRFLWEKKAKRFYSVEFHVQETPNATALKFVPSEVPRLFMSLGNVNYVRGDDYPTHFTLIHRLFQLQEVHRVYVNDKFLTVTIDGEHYSWNTQLQNRLKDLIQNAVNEESGDLFVLSSREEQEQEEDETVAAIKQVLETHVRPLLEEDGGDLRFVKFENGIVHVQLQGSCEECSSSTITLRFRIENMLKHYIPEVQGVEQYVPEITTE